MLNIKMVESFGQDACTNSKLTLFEAWEFPGRKTTTNYLLVAAITIMCGLLMNFMFYFLTLCVWIDYTIVGGWSWKRSRPGAAISVAIAFLLASVICLILI